jgi:3-oxoacyl-[acyl-carrier-protein] synthase-1
VSITAFGAVTSVGYDAVTTCASIRAGLVRPSSLDTFEVLDVAAQAPVGLTAHPVGELTRGFSGVGRWLQMAALALEDLANTAALAAATDTRFWSSTLCCVVLPFPDPDRFDPTGASGSEAALRVSFVRPLLQRCGAFFAPASVALLLQGRIGALAATRMAAERIAAGRAERVLVLAVDSLVDEPSLLWLAQWSRLKDDANPVGLVPGEGAVAFVLEAAPVAARRGLSSAALVRAVAMTRDPNPFVLGEPNLGQGLAEAVQHVLVEAGVRLPFRSEVISDMNGESWRGEEYGHARVRVPSGEWDGDQLTLPATSVGDVGATMTALQFAVGSHSLKRRLRTGGDALIVASDEYGHAGAAILSREQ